jgi:hypothetical protein
LVCLVNPLEELEQTIALDISPELMREIMVRNVALLYASRLGPSK